MWMRNTRLVVWEVVKHTSSTVPSKPCRLVKGIPKTGRKSEVRVHNVNAAEIRVCLFTGWLWGVVGRGANRIPSMFGGPNLRDTQQWTDTGLSKRYFGLRGIWNGAPPAWIQQGATTKCNKPAGKSSSITTACGINYQHAAKDFARDSEKHGRLPMDPTGWFPGSVSQEPPVSCLGRARKEEQRPPPGAPLF